ncbi:DNA-binding response regulator [Enterococcus ureilyticus]|uniref:DNA-binding response regulator n=1 Tax=Enterococcus ureilyticus TaxID=1131292 RepID=A0A1E5H8N1_9ENTE|nr:response regulator transcription factor [Enterococcus ureilyticus]MBM7688601.1 two-component system response regulator CiaR [Enterococcus ureilyticus]MBO0445051.1 response regulator transcription factor [Enterococcus ureilyticus]OEG21264.1 DNA-binding response regulator [Enterococcus ureilyticus]
MLKILLVEDDEILSDSILEILSEVGEIVQVYDGEEALYEAERGIYDLVVLDLMLPLMTGEQVLSALRQKNIYTPVLILTAKDGLEDKVNGFKNGGDDYLTKPFHREELLLRVQALARRALGMNGNNELVVNELRLDLDNRHASYKGNELTLQGKEFDLLHYLMQNQGRIITKDQLFDRIWGFQSDTTLTVVEVYMSNLRKNLKPFGLDRWIRTLRNVGYLFEASEGE